MDQEAEKSLHRPDAGDLRYGWVDIAKGIGIASVVMAHVVQQGAVVAFATFYCVQIFFFLSGYFFAPRTDLKRYALRKAKSLLLPYLALLILFSPFHFAESFAMGKPWWKALIDLGLGGVWLDRQLGVVWFLPCLYMAQQCLNWMLSRWPLRRVLAANLAMLALAWSITAIAPHRCFPLDLNAVLVACPTVLAGYLYRLHARPWMLGLAWLLAAVGAVLCVLGLPVHVNLKQGVFGIPVLSFVLCIAATVVVMQLSQWTAKLPVVRRIFIALGRMSMGIMCLQEALRLAPGIFEFTLVHRNEGFVVVLAGAWAISALLARIYLAISIAFEAHAQRP